MELNKLESERLIKFYDTDMLPEMPFDIEISKLIEKDSKYLINHNDNQNLKDVEDLILERMMS